MKDMKVLFPIVGVLLLGACGSPTPPAAKVSSIELSEPALKIGTATQINAALKDSQFNTVSGKTLVWTSSNPEVASVDGSGKVTAHNFGTVKITASVDGVSDTTQDLKTFGLRAVGGTKAATGGSAFLFNFRNATETPLTTQKVSIKITGPAGWFSNKTFNASVNYAGARIMDWFSVSSAGVPIPAVTGTYTLALTADGQTYTDTFTVDASQKLPAVTGVTLGHNGLTEVTVNWNPVAGASKYLVELVNTADKSLVDAFYTSNTSLKFSDLSLNAANSYAVTVSAFSLNPAPSGFETPLKSQFNFSDATVALNLL